MYADQYWNSLFPISIYDDIYGIYIGSSKCKLTHNPFVYPSDPEAPDDLIFIEQEVNSMFVMWTHPPGRVDGYRVG